MFEGGVHMKHHKLLTILLAASFLFVLAAATAQQKTDDKAATAGCQCQMSHETMAARMAGAGCPMMGQTAKGPAPTGGCPMMAGKAGEAKGCQMMGQGQGMKAGSCCADCPMMSKDVEKKIENTPDGVIVMLTSKNPETVKKLQEHFAKMAAGCMCGCGMAKSACEKPAPPKTK
jgi:hypothetical protein